MLLATDLEIIQAFNEQGEIISQFLAKVDKSGRIFKNGTEMIRLKDGKPLLLNTLTNIGVVLRVKEAFPLPTQPGGAVVREWVSTTTTGEESDFSTFKEYENGFILEQPHY